MAGWLKTLQASVPKVAQARRSRVRLRAAKTAAEAVTQVTLVIYGWKNAEPGKLAWVFPSLAAAIGAVNAMRNAVRWAIVPGSRVGHDIDVVAARASGLVFAEAV